MILGRSIQRNAGLFPDRPALVSEAGEIISHSEFADRVFRLANALLRNGIGHRSRISILARNSVDYICLYYACGTLGAWCVPINNMLKAPEIDFRLRHVEADAIFLDADFLPILESLSQEVRQRLNGRVYLIDRDADERVSIDELAEHGSSTPPDIYLSPEDILYVGYTSGTTGSPKGALVSHRAIVAGFLYKAIDYRLDDKDVTINAGPYWHSAPRDFASLAVYLGGTAVVPSRFDADHYLELVEAHRATNSFVVPTMLQRLLGSPSLGSRELGSLRCLISGGAPLPTTIKERVLARFGPILTEFYGATETRIVSTITPHELAERERSVGRPIRDVNIRVLDGDGEEVPDGTVGEVYIRGPGLFSGYWRDEERTKAAHRGEWFSLGDMGRVDSEGYLYLVDRKQDMIITGGENVYPKDIEECLERHPAVKEAGVVGTPDDQWGEVIVAHVVLDVREVKGLEEAIIDHCKALLPPYMKPRRINFCESLPRNETGKLLRRKLRASAEMVQ